MKFLRQLWPRRESGKDEARAVARKWAEAYGFQNVPDYIADEIAHRLQQPGVVHVIDWVHSTEWYKREERYWRQGRSRRRRLADPPSRA